MTVVTNERTGLSDCKAHILIVEDEPMQARIVSRLLERSRFRCSVSTSGEEALEFLAVHRPDLMLSDIVMPGIDGFELCRRVKRDPGLRDIPVVLVTQLSEPQDIIKGLNVGADSYLTKPFDAKTLVETVETALGIEMEATTDGFDGTRRESLAIQFGGTRYSVETSHRQAISLLLTTYSNVMRHVRELDRLRQEMLDLNQRLDDEVRERTATLEAEIRRREAAVGRSQMLSSFPENAPYLVLSVDEAGEMLYANPTARELAAERKVADALALLPADFSERRRECIETGQGQVDVESWLGNVVLNWAIQPVPDSRVVHAYGRDETERYALERRRIHEALHDRLTGLPVREVFLDRVQRSIEVLKRRPLRRFAVLVVSIRGFRRLVGTMGHERGDEFLKQIAGRLREQARAADTLARLGTKEFVLLAEDIHDRPQAIKCADRFVKALEPPFKIGDREVFCSPRVGIATCAPEYQRAEDMLRDADAAVARIGPEEFPPIRIFDYEVHRQALQRLEIDGRLRHALPAGHVVAWYQPIHRICNLRLEAYEALARWRDGDEFISPGTFIPVAEESGLIQQLGTRILRQACAQARVWQLSRPLDPPHVSVNISARQFVSDDIVEEVSRLLAESRLTPDRLYLEITETVLMGDPEKAARNLKQLRTLGCRVSLDDFGTGFSSLSYLDRFPADVLKIDRQFVADLTTSGRRRSIVRAVIEMAHEVGMEVVAEGVETAEQLGILNDFDCDFAQGFYFSPAVDADSATRMLELNQSEDQA